jgi:hypothetical protein
MSNGRWTVAVALCVMGLVFAAAALAADSGFGPLKGR